MTLGGGMIREAGSAGKDGRSMVDGWMCAVCTCMRIYMNRCVQMKVCSAWTRAAVLGSAVGRRVDDGGRDERGMSAYFISESG